MPNLFIIAGPNGAGKTTASYTVLPEMLDCKEFVNADEIARGLSPFQFDKAAIEAGRLMLNRINKEPKFNEKIEKAKESGYFVTLVYFWLSSPELAIERVRTRVNEGGHNIAEEIIRRRYRNGAKNLIQLYLPVSDYWLIIDNSESPFKLIAEGFLNNDKQINDYTIWNQINQNSNGK